MLCYVMYLFHVCIYYILDVNFKFRKQNAHWCKNKIHLCSVIAGRAPFIPHLPSCIHLCGPQDHSTWVMLNGVPFN